MVSMGNSEVKSSSANATSSDVQIKSEIKSEDLDMAPFYTVYNSVDDIPYSANSALEEGIKMVNRIEAQMAKLTLNNLRQEVWDKNLDDLKARSVIPKTLIAVCGATGTGKSSMLNALLEDNIVPTSGMRACTAVVTEISYHSKSRIEADVSFLSESEWKQELIVLQFDLTEEDGSVKRVSDLRSDAGVAWQKVRAVYPSVSQEQLVNMTADQIIALDPRVSEVLGTTKRISARDSERFGRRISKYIDSQDQSWGVTGNEKDKGGNEKDSDGKNISAERIPEAAAEEKQDPHPPAFWPLIRQVNVRCSAKCLSSGCVLVDLPGVADANAARNSIAKDYMKRAQCIWVLAPITRAVDDKIARDLLGDAFKTQLMNGNYHDDVITFIASKTDDISCSEVIRALHLENDPELRAIEEKLKHFHDQTVGWLIKSKESGQKIETIKTELESMHAMKKEFQEHIEAIKNGDNFTPVLTVSTGIKRGNVREGKKGSSKRRRSSRDSDRGDDNVDESDNSDSDSDSGQDSISDDPEGEENGISALKMKEPDGKVTQESIQVKLRKIDSDIEDAEARLYQARKRYMTVTDDHEAWKRSSRVAQRTKNGWCSKKRSEYSRNVLREDFRTGLKELDGIKAVDICSILYSYPELDQVAEKTDPQNFDPSVNRRDYGAINLPVFCCSSRDYVRLTKQVDGDGDPTCFSDKASTGIPDLQMWCHELTAASQMRTVKNFYDLLRIFALTISLFVRGISGITAADREALREKWESPNNYKGSEEDDKGSTASVYRRRRRLRKMSEIDQTRGVTARLNKEFAKLISECVQELKARVKDGLEDKCRMGASLSANSAVQISDDFASSTRWNTYRATLKRHGEWHRDLNAELVAPFTRNVAASWNELFETDLLHPFEATIQNAVRHLVQDLADSAAPGLNDRIKTQGDMCMDESDFVLKQAVGVVRRSVNSEQKEVSRCLAPHVQSNLVDGYELAMQETGKGSAARQKKVFHAFLSERKDNVFDEGANVMLDRLDMMCSSVGKALRSSFKELAKKIEVNLAVLWEKTQDDPKEATGGEETMKVITEILSQSQLWLDAANLKANNTSEGFNTETD